MTLDKIVLGFCAAVIIAVAVSDFFAWYSGTVPIFIG